MDYTQNLHLPQWEETDRIMMDDFNDAFDKIDTAVAEKCNMIVGVYTGDGAESRDIELGVTPKAVMIWINGTTQDDGILYGGVSVAGHNSNVVTITESGLTVYHSNGIGTNISNGNYFYVVLY